jgi:hypothetical protein
VVTLVAAAVVVAGAPARQTAQAAVVEIPVEVEIEAVPLPSVTIAAEVEGLNSEIANGGAGELAVALAEDLMIEGEAMRRADSTLLRAADDGQRLLAMERRVEVAATRGEFVVASYRFESLHLVVVFTDGSQGGASLAFEAAGVVEHVTLDNDGLEVQRVETPFESVFVMRRGAGQRWLIVDELPPE